MGSALRSLASLFRRLTARQSVETITAPFAKMARDLEIHAASQTEQANRDEAFALDLRMSAADRKKEAERALNLAGAIGGLAR
ncbi:hypothetical protein [Aureimonas sp. AU40]|uniref:hypothetical protein n=1 Tax=Aureimonas sp. AU40 TaxID=1637747 RepID=UPI0007836774|nr:hypothetical protein [Aureimonas sp. AU40]